MRFWIADNSLYDSKRNTYLYVSLDKETIKYKCKNFVDGYLGIFSNNLIDENTYYNECANKMRKSGFNGFIDWITSVINEYDTTLYLDDKLHEIHYTDLVFLTDNEILKLYIKKLFEHFNFTINELKNANIMLF